MTEIGFRTDHLNLTSPLESPKPPWHPRPVAGNLQHSPHTWISSMWGLQIIHDVG